MQQKREQKRATATQTEGRNPPKRRTSRATDDGRQAMTKGETPLRRGPVCEGGVTRGVSEGRAGRTDGRRGWRGREGEAERMRCRMTDTRDRRRPSWGNRSVEDEVLQIPASAERSVSSEMSMSFVSVPDAPSDDDTAPTSRQRLVVKKSAKTITHSVTLAMTTRIAFVSVAQVAWV